jgi:hypothetical protein
LLRLYEATRLLAVAADTQFPVDVHVLGRPYRRGFVWPRR